MMQSRVEERRHICTGRVFRQCGLVLFTACLLGAVNEEPWLKGR